MRAWLVFGLATLLLMGTAFALFERSSTSMGGGGMQLSCQLSMSDISFREPDQRAERTVSAGEAFGIQTPGGRYVMQIQWDDPDMGVPRVPSPGDECPTEPRVHRLVAGQGGTVTIRTWFPDPAPLS